MPLSVNRATLDDLDAVAPLFADYRRFYAQTRDVPTARAFLAARLGNDESVVFLARLTDGTPAGFTQLYPTFSSVRAGRVWVLNDLYVAEHARRRGVAGALLQAAEAFARADGALRLELETTPDNFNAQALYRKLGWRPYDDTLRFRLPLDPA